MEHDDSATNDRAKVAESASKSAAVDGHYSAAETHGEEHAEHPAPENQPVGGDKPDQDHSA